MTQDELKKAAACAALDYIADASIVGVGTGSTVNHFIDALASRRDRILGAVSSSEASTRRLRAHGIEVFDLNGIETLPVYVDGADATPASTTTVLFNLQPDLDVRIGMGGPTGGRFLTGLVDDARIYDRVLSPEEIASLAGRIKPYFMDRNRQDIDL